MSNKEVKEPKHFLVLRILGFLLLAVGITLVVLAWTVLGEPFVDTIKPSFAALVPGMFMCVISIALLFSGYSPKIAKLNAKGERYIQQETKDELKDIADTKVDIHSEAITNSIKAVKKGLKDTKYCKHCGAEIDADSTFCKECGKKQ